MTFALKAVDAWWTMHPHLVDLVLFCLAVFASIFPERSRRWVLKPVSYSAFGVLRFMQRDAKRQLEIMRRIGDSAFNLVAYIGFYCIHAVLWTLTVSAVLFAGVNLFSYWRTGHPSFVPFNLLFFGGLLGRAIRLYLFLGGLLDRENTIKLFEKMASGESTASS